MKAVILSGGKGTRLLPLTDKKPKPLITVGDKSILSCLLEQLSQKGIKEAALTLGYRKDDIKKEFGSEWAGIKLHYFEEDEPLGTAGGIKNCEKFLDSDFLVISGDSVCEIDLERALESHQKKNSLATMVLTPCEDVLEYGVVLLNADGSVKGFSEKPSWEGVKSDLVNCGTYIFKKEFLSLIPKDTFCDLSGDIFPKMLEDGLCINTFITHLFWCDVGSFHSLYSCNMKTLSEDFFIRYRPKNVSVNKVARVTKSVLGENTLVKENACITRSVIGRNCEIAEGAKLYGCILGDGVRIGKGACVERGAVIGDGTVIGDGMTVNEKCRLSSGSRLEDDGVSLSFTSDSELLLQGEIILNPAHPDNAFQLGRAAVALSHEIGVLHSDSHLAHLACESFALGAAWGGGECIVFSEGTGKDAAFAAGSFLIPTFAFEEKDGKIHVYPYDADSLPLSQKSLRKLVGAFDRPSPVKEVGSIRYFDGLEIAERQEIRRLFSSAAKSEGAVAVKDNRHGRRFFSHLSSDCFNLCRKPVFEDFFIEISPDRNGISLFVSGDKLDTEHSHALILKNLIREGKRVFYLPSSAPEALDVIARAHGAKIIRTDKNALPSANPAAAFSDLWARDALFAAPLLYRVLSAHSFSEKKLRQTLDSLPVFLCVEKSFDTQKFSVGHLMRELESRGEGSLSKDGILLKKESGEVRVTPEGKRRFKLFAEARNAEAAEELCDFARGIINDIEKG